MTGDARGQAALPHLMTSVLTRADAVLFDLDGVLTDTASLHRVAWRRLFTEFLDQFARTGIAAVPYTDDDYYRLIDGKPRLDGIRAVLASRRIELQEGDPGDPEYTATIHGLSNRKNAAFLGRLREGGVETFPGSVALVRWLLSVRVRCAVVSSSQNAVDVLRGAGLDGLFELVVDGRVATGVGLRGKPAPDTFLWAARQLGADPGNTVVVEDAVSGVQAARAGGFTVVGVDRGTGAASLAAAGADVVVTDAAELVPVRAEGDPVAGLLGLLGAGERSAGR